MQGGERGYRGWGAAGMGSSCHAAPAVREQREVSAGTQLFIFPPFLFSPRPQGMRLLMFRVGLPSSGNLSGHLTNTLRGVSQGTPRLVDSED